MTRYTLDPRIVLQSARNLANRNRSRLVTLAAKTCCMVLGGECAGFLAYYVRPRLRNHWGGPFNGQRQRQKIFRDVLGVVPFVAIVETGTFRGDTTLYLRSESGLEVFTVENQALNHGFAKARFMRDRGIHALCDDSRAALRKLARRAELRGRSLFFYLDAHWGQDLPLQEEVEIIATYWPHAVVMVDDFAVPDDAGYGYDDYGEARALTLEYLSRSRNVSYGVFFPAASSDAESGARRGCVLLAFRPDVVKALSQVRSLRGGLVTSPQPGRRRTIFG